MVNKSIFIVFCDWFWPIEYSNNAESGIGDPSLEARLFSAVTGVDMDEKGYLLTGERCVNLCRAIYVREGRRGRADDVLEDFNYTTPLEGQEPPIGLFNPELIVPAADGSMTSRIGAVVERDMFNKLMDEYYNERGWDLKSGLPTKKCFERVGLTDIAPDLEARGFLK